MSKKLPPIHPGEILREEFMKPLDVQSWLNLQIHHDIRCAEDAAGRAIQRIRPRQSPGGMRLQ